MMPSAFSTSSLATAVHQTLDDAYAAIPDGHTHAVLLDGHYSRPDGPSGRIVFAQKEPDGWNVASYIGYDKPHGAVAGVDLLKSW